MASFADSTITREQLISPDYVKIALQNCTTMVRFVDGEMQEIPLPESCKETLTLPEGYTVDFLFDPVTAIAAFARAGYTSLDQLPTQAQDLIKEQINRPSNMKIVPFSIQQGKLEAITQALAAQKPDESELAA